MLTFVIFILVFAGMIFVHEFGHFLAARLFRIPVDEFGFGFPPRLLRFWRGKGSIQIGETQIEIPNNFDLPFDWQDSLHKPVKATVDTVDDRIVLRSIELVQTEQSASLPQPVASDPVGSFLEPFPTKSNQPTQGITRRGETEITGPVNKIDAGTEFTINLLPLGGFVRPRGENNPNVPDGLAAANPWKRLGVLLAGPFMNLLTAFVVYSILVAQVGMPVPGKVLIADVESNSPAAQAGIQAQDVIVKINGETVTDMDTARNLIRAHMDQPIQLVLDRGGKEITVTATPLSSRSAQQGALGVALAYPYRPATIGESVSSGLTITGIQAASLVYLPVALVRGAIPASDARLVGFKGMYDMFGAAVQRDATTRAQASSSPSSAGSSLPNQEPTNYTLELIAMLSISLGVLNLLPIPALDGGRILFTLPEILFKRRIPPHMENIINGVAFLMLIALMVYVNVMDFINPININLP